MTERERALVANASMGRMESGRIQRTTSLPASLGGGGVPWGPSMVRIVGRGAQQGTPPSTSPATKHIFCLFLESPDVTLGQKTTRTQEMRSLSFALMPLSNETKMRQHLDTRGACNRQDTFIHKMSGLIFQS